MKFGHEYEQVLATEDFPTQWLGSAIDYKYMKKCIKKIHRELEDLGLDAETIIHLSGQIASEQRERGNGRPKAEHHEFYSAEEPHLKTIPEEFSPQLRILVDSRTGTPLDATLAPETRAGLQHLVKHEIATAGRHEYLGHRSTHELQPRRPSIDAEDVQEESAPRSEAKWVQIPLASAKDFFDMLAPKLEELEKLRDAETERLEDDILELGRAVEDVVEPVREGYEAKRRVSYKDLYWWREMFRLYLENPIFYASTEQNRGGVSFLEAKSRLQAYDQQVRDIGLLNKMKTPQARKAAKMFLDLNVNILKIMHFQEMNARAMSKIIKKFSKRTHLEGQTFLKDLRSKYPTLEIQAPGRTRKNTGAAGFANSIARDLDLELRSKVLSIVPQPDEWQCPVCSSLAWRPVSLGCCNARFCIRCVIKLQDDGHEKCPMCNAESVMKADGRNIDFETLDFLEKYFKLEVQKRQRENEEADLVRRYGEDFVAGPKCSVM
ncbi:putative RING finger protein [Teratosphaeria destructans]|uniref:RING finger protein n=1 Tax=Teratosphaeria destructans TaxID=418781 RepID=A0A9W7SU41_9PEZI|nr:putative RING finger protein [Teratosphaeria destructans]